MSLTTITNIMGFIVIGSCIVLTLYTVIDNHIFNKRRAKRLKNIDRLISALNQIPPIKIQKK